MATISFLVNGATVGHTKTKTWVTIEEIEDGSLFFRVKQIGGSMGNLHGLYFDVLDGNLLNTFRVTTISNDICIKEDSINYLRNGTNMNVSEADNNRGDIGNGKEVFNSYGFTLSSNARILSLCDFPHMELDYAKDYGNSNTKNCDDKSHRWIYMGLL